MAKVAIERNHVAITIEGIRKLGTLKNKFSIPLKHVTNIEPAPDIAFPRFGQKVIGTDAYGFYFGGTFKQRGKKVFWDVRKRKNTVVITLRHEKFDRLILEVDNPQDVTQRIKKAI